MENLVCGECGTVIENSGCEHYNPKEIGWYGCIVEYENKEQYSQDIYFNGHQFKTDLLVKSWRKL